MQNVFDKQKSAAIPHFDENTFLFWFKLSWI